MTYGVRLARRIGYKKTCLACMIIYSSSIFASSYAQHFWHFLILYAVIPNIAMGMAFQLPIYCGQYAFPMHRGRVIGFIVSAFGFSSFFVSILLTFEVNPENLPPEKPAPDFFYSYFGEEVTKNVPGFLRILGVVYFIVGGIGAILVTHHKERTGLLESSVRRPSLSFDKAKTIEQLIADSSRSADLVPYCPSIKSAFRTAPFYQIFFMQMFGVMYPFAVALFYKVYG